jgi:sterol desaturase/sphingolipid hydroxylase (fatty acid hydroxylase superfamily)
MIALAAVLGVLTWSFLEYVIHRWLGHDRRLVKRTPFGIEHTAHHSQGGYFAPTWKKALAAIAALGLMAPLAIAVAGTTLGLTYAIAFASFYVVYELVHRLLHVWRGVGPYARWARRHHFFHHFHDPSLNHGVTSPLWDIVFGTRANVDVVQVPEKLAMTWLVDPTTGDVHPSLAQDYALRRAKRAA